MQFDRGFLSPHFVTNQDEVIRRAGKLPTSCSTKRRSSSNKKLIPLLEAISKANKPLLIIAEDIEGEALATLVVNKMRGILQVCAVKAPGYGDRRKAIMGDIAVADRGHADLQGPGHRAGKRQAHRPRPGQEDQDHVAKNTIIVGGAGTKDEIDGRAEQIRDEIEPHRQRVRPREAAGAAGQAGRRRGPDQLRRRDRDRDEGAEVRCSKTPRTPSRPPSKSGIVPGGGVALIRAEKAIDKLKLEGDEKAGARSSRTSSISRCGRSPTTPASMARWSSTASAS